MIRSALAGVAFFFAATTAFAQPYAVSRNGDVVLAIADDGDGVPDEIASGTGLSIVRALVRDELRGTLDLSSTDGTRAEVVFPA